MSDFQAALDHVLRWEGGYVDDEADSGGRTHYGISEAAHPDAWADGPPTEEQAIAIYRERYWSHKRINAGEVGSDMIATYLFDCAVNHGPAEAAELLQKAVARCGGDNKVDGWVGPNTRQNLRRYPTLDVLDRFVLARVELYRAIVERDDSQQKFLHGWLNRALNIVDL